MRQYNNKWEEKCLWLLYDEDCQGVFCKECKKDGKSLQRTGGTWVIKPFTNWKKALEKMKAHSQILIIRVTLQKLWTPEHDRSEIFNFQKSVRLRTLQLLRTTLRKPCSRINVRCEQSWICPGICDLGELETTEKPSSMVTTRYDEENPVFLAMYCDCLRVPFIFPHSLSVNGSSGIAPRETIRSRHFVLRHKVASTPYITPRALTEYRSCALLAIIIGHTQNLHCAVNGWFMWRQSHI